MLYGAELGLSAQSLHIYRIKSSRLLSLLCLSPLQGDRSYLPTPAFLPCESWEVQAFAVPSVEPAPIAVQRTCPRARSF